MTLFVPAVPAKAPTAERLRPQKGFPVQHTPRPRGEKVIEARVAQLFESYKASEMHSPQGRAVVVPAAEMPADLLIGTRLREDIFDHRYYDIVHRTLGGEFTLEYLLLVNAQNQFQGACPFFLREQDVLAGMKGHAVTAAGRVRRRFPTFMTLRTLMFGNPAGAGVPGFADAVGEGSPQVARHLADVLVQLGQRRKAHLVVFKDVPGEFRSDMACLMEGSVLHGTDYARIASMPMTRLSLAPYRSFEDYMQRSLSKVTRKGIRRKFRDSEGADLHMTVTNDVSGCLDEIYKLYLQVYERSAMKFERLTPEFFLQLGKRMPDTTRFFLWRMGGPDGRIVAFSATLVRTRGEHADTSIHDLYLGMEYPLALDLHLYFVTMRDIIDWAIDNGIENYYSTPLNYDAKLHFRHRLVPLDLYVRHTSPVLNPLFKMALRFAGPTRHDKILPKFPNAAELEGP